MTKCLRGFGGGAPEKNFAYLRGVFENFLWKNLLFELNILKKILLIRGGGLFHPILKIENFSLIRGGLLKGGGLLNDPVYWFLWHTDAIQPGATPPQTLSYHVVRWFYVNRANRAVACDFLFGFWLILANIE